MAQDVHIYGPSVTPVPVQYHSDGAQLPVTHESRLQHHGRAAVNQQHCLQHRICRYKRSRPGKFARPERLPRQHDCLRLLAATVSEAVSLIPLGTSYNHILQLNNDGYSNYNSLQISYKRREIFMAYGADQLHLVPSLRHWVRQSRRHFLSNYQNPYDVSKDYAPSDFDTPWNINFTLVYDVPKIRHYQN